MTTKQENELLELLTLWFKEIAKFNNRRFKSRNKVARELKKQLELAGHWIDRRTNKGKVSKRKQNLLNKKEMIALRKERERIKKESENDLF